MRLSWFLLLRGFGRAAQISLSLLQQVPAAASRTHPILSSAANCAFDSSHASLPLSCAPNNEKSRTKKSLHNELAPPLGSSAARAGGGELVFYEYIKPIQDEREI